MVTDPVSRSPHVGVEGADRQVRRAQAQHADDHRGNCPDQRDGCAVTGRHDRLCREELSPPGHL
jgi:hypothetical protein